MSGLFAVEQATTRGALQNQESAFVARPIVQDYDAAGVR